MRRGLFTLVALFMATGVAAQAPPRVVVRDSTGRRVPYASVQSGGGVPRTANDSGVAVLNVPPADSLKLLARRVGFAPYAGWVKASEGGEYRVELNPLPQNLNRVTIFERETPLARAGFYDRMERVERGAIVARFWTPEAIELRNPSRLSALFESETIVRVRRVGQGKAMLVGRNSQCVMGLIVDGQRMLGTVEEIASRQGESEVRQRLRRYEDAGVHDARFQAERDFLSTRLSIDDIVSALAVTGVEIYATVASAPPEIQRNAPDYACGLVVVWTGRR